MVRYVLKQNKNEDSKVYGKWFAYPVIEETLNLDDRKPPYERNPDFTSCSANIIF